MGLTLKNIKEDPIKRGMFLDGFSHGNIGIQKQNPSYEKESYDLGYKYGKEGKINEYIEMVRENDKSINKFSPATRQKRKRKK